MLDVNIREIENVAVIDLKGKITIGVGAETFRNVVDDLLIDGQRKILFNFSGVIFIDSTGLGEIVASYRTVRGLNGEMKIYNIGGRVYSTFSISKLLPILEIYDNEEDAIESYREGKTATAAAKAGPGAVAPFAVKKKAAAKKKAAVKKKPAAKKKGAAGKKGGAKKKSTKKRKSASKK